jgi:signal transduction histidine kinase
VHEIRNPLVSIKTFVELLPERFEDPEFRERFLAVALGEIRRVERLCDRVLDHAAPQRGIDDAAADVGAAVAWAFDVLALRMRQHGLVLAPSIGSPLPQVSIPSDALRQLLLNLLLNAAEASPPGGRIRVEAVQNADEVVIHVRDEGTGVPVELRTRIFEPYFSTRRERPGGLGLAISRRIAEEAGGSLVLVDEEAPGAVFRVAIPGKRQA